MEENLKRLEQCKTFMGGDNDDIPINRDAISDIQDLVKMVYLNKLPQPEIFSWAGGIGLQAEWEYKNYYIEVDSNGKNLDLFICEDRDYDKSLNMKIKNIQCCFNVVKAIMNGLEPEKGINEKIK